MRVKLLAHKSSAVQVPKPGLIRYEQELVEHMVMGQREENVKMDEGITAQAVINPRLICKPKEE